MSNFDEIVGNVKKEVGDAIGNSKLQAEGLIQEGVGKAKEVAANLEKQAEKLLLELKEMGKKARKLPNTWPPKPKKKPKIW